MRRIDRSDFRLPVTINTSKFEVLRRPVESAAELFKEWEHHKVEGILTYRNRSYPSVLTGDMAPAHHTPWMEALDDSLEAFLGLQNAAE